MDKFHELPSIDTEVEYYPVITAIKDNIERFLRVTVTLASWLNEKNLKIRKKADADLAKVIFSELKKLVFKKVPEAEQLRTSEQEDLENLIEVNTVLLKQQHYFTKWAIYLYEKYSADIKQFVTFAFK